MSAQATNTRHLLSINDLGADGIEEILRLTDSFIEVSERAIPKVPALRGKTVEPDQLKSLLVPYTGEMIAWPVSQRVGNVKNNDASLIEPVTVQ